MNIAALILPDFALIVLGFAIARLTRWGDAFWEPVEKVTFYVLFPALLFYATARAPLDFGATLPMLGTMMVGLTSGFVLAWLAQPLFRPKPATFAGGMQCAYRFNSYLGFALIARMHGEAGLALMAIALVLYVPVVNAVSLWVMVRAKGALHPWRELARNPLILSAAAGVLWNWLGLPLPDAAVSVLQRLGQASIALGLLAVGAALRLDFPGNYRVLVSYWLAVKMIAVPAIVLVCIRALGLTGPSAAVPMLIAALPAATATYILAQRMGADGRIAAMQVSIGVLLAAITVPIWLALLG